LQKKRRYNKPKRWLIKRLQSKGLYSKSERHMPIKLDRNLSYKNQWTVRERNNKQTKKPGKWHRFSKMP
jgi:hypothetical protein